MYSLQSTILVQSAVLKCNTADVNFLSSFVCTLANSGYNEIFSLTDILQIAGCYPSSCICTVFANFLQVPNNCVNETSSPGLLGCRPFVWRSQPSSKFYQRLNLSIDFSIIYSPGISHNQTKPKEKKDRLRKKRK